MIIWKKIAFVLVLSIGIVTFFILTNIYPIRIPAVFNSWMYSESLWKYYKGNCKNDVVHFNEDFVKNLDENGQLEIYWRSPGDYFLHLVNNDTGEVCAYIRK